MRLRLPWLVCVLVIGAQGMHCRSAEALGAAVTSGTKGVALLIGFFGLAILLLVWTFIIAPLRASRILKMLESHGYREIDAGHPELRSWMNRLAPFALEGPVQPDSREMERSISKACVFAGGSRYVANVSQMHYTYILPVQQDVHGDASKIWQMLVFEPRKLNIAEDVYIRPRSADQPLISDRLARFGLREMTSTDLDPRFHELYCVATPGDHSVPIPRTVQHAFVSLERHLVHPPGISRGTFRKDLLWRVHVKLGPAGWGICASDVWLHQETMNALITVSDSIAQNL